MRATLSEKGQVTIPKAVRDRLGLRPGQVLEFRAEKGRLVATKAKTDAPVDEVYGMLELDAATDELLDGLRGPADAV